VKCADLLIPPAPPVDLGDMHLIAALHPRGFRFPDRGGSNLKIAAQTNGRIRFKSNTQYWSVVRKIVPTANRIADYLESLKAHVLERWRAEVRNNPEQAETVSKLDDRELQDHLPLLTDDIIQCLRGQPVDRLEGAAARHGRQRRRDGYQVIPLMRELQIFRRVLLSMLDEIKSQFSADQVNSARDQIITIVDRSMNVSVLQYTLAAEEERNSAQNEASALHQQRDRFLVTLSHELRNQVSPILLGVHLLKNLKLPDTRMLKAVERIERQARHQAILIDDLLDINRFRYGKLQLKRESLDLREPVQHALETMQGDVAAKHLKLQAQLPGRPLMASADRTRVAQILINLLTNAIKFTPPGGTISVELKAQEKFAVLSVTDTGLGFDPRLTPQLFGMFFQGEDAQAKSGLGIGLALSKILAEMHGGAIEAYSQGEGKGARFIVRLPALKHTAPSLQASRKVLLVDDNPDHLELLADLLRVRGHEVIEARDGAQGIKAALEQKPRACVIDIGLPDMDGYELASRLRKAPDLRDALLIALTGYGTRAESADADQGGFNFYFLKPPDIDELDRVLSSQLG
jgi:signal transduction histidine kinase/CheY-like chemotaxis protein